MSNNYMVTAKMKGKTKMIIAGKTAEEAKNKLMKLVQDYIKQGKNITYIFDKDLDFKYKSVRVNTNQK